MSYKNVNSGRLKYLLMFGCEPAELRAFLTESQIRLIQSGEKAQNLPKDLEKRISFIAGLGAKAIPIFERWFREHLSAVDIVLASEAISRFQAFESDAAESLDDEQRKLSRSVLAQLVSDSTPPELIEFLQTPMPGEKVKKRDKSAKEEAEAADNDLERRYAPSMRDLQVIAAAILGSRDIDAAETITESLTEDYVRALVSARDRDWERYANYEARLTEEGIYRDALEAVVDEFRRAAYTGFKELALEEVSSASEVDLRKTEVIAHCTNVIAGGTAFLKPILLWDGNVAKTATERVLADLFPTRGELMAFPNTPGLKTPEHHEVGAWLVETFDSDKPVRAKIRKHGSAIYEVVRIPVASSDYDKIREALKSSQIGGRRKVIFETADKLLIRPRKDLHEVVRDGFKDPLDAWTALSGFSWHGRRFIVGPVGEADVPYDCSEIEAVLQRLLGLQVESENIPKLTKANIRALTAAFRVMHRDVDVDRAESLRHNLERYLASDDTLSRVTELLLGYPRIRSEINEAVTKEVSKAMDSKKELVNELRRLEEKRSALEKSIKQRESDQRKLPSQVSSAVRDAFDKAKAQGAETLGTAAVFEHILGGLNSSMQPYTHGPTLDFSSPKLTWRRLDPLEGRIEATLANHGTPLDYATILERVIDITAKAGLILVFSGVAAGSVAESVARNLAKKAVLVANVGIGLIGVESISLQLRELGDTADCLVLKAANHSDVECYAVDLLDYVLARIVSGDHYPPAIIFTLSDGPSGLPLSSRSDRIAVHINLDTDIGTNGGGEITDLMEVAEEEERKAGRRVWRPALKRLAAAHRELSPESQRAVVSQIKRGFVDVALRSSGKNGG